MEEEKKIYVLVGLVTGNDFERVDIEGVFTTLNGAKKGLKEMYEIVKGNEMIIGLKKFETTLKIITENNTIYDYQIVEKEIEK